MQRTNNLRWYTLLAVILVTILWFTRTASPAEPQPFYPFIELFEVDGESNTVAIGVRHSTPYLLLYSEDNVRWRPILESDIPKDADGSLNYSSKHTFKGNGPIRKMFFVYAVPFEWSVAMRKVTKSRHLLPFKKPFPTPFFSVVGKQIIRL